VNDERTALDVAPGDPGLKFRIVRLHGRRRAFSLEPEFWAVLEAMAAAEGRRLGHLIEDMLAQDASRNAAAALRLAALRWQSEAIARARRDASLVLRRVISAIPAPACALSSAQAILARNRPFRDLQARVSERPDDGEATRLTLGASLARIAAALDGDGERAVSVPFVLRSREGRSLAGQLNISGMPGGGAERTYLCVVRPGA
jgi:predicted DNA-binding ribbon-helix-helix protein